MKKSQTPKLSPVSPPSYPNRPIYVEREREEHTVSSLVDPTTDHGVTATMLDDFFAYLTRDGSVNLAAQAAGIEPSVIYVLAERSSIIREELRKARLRGLQTAIDANLQAIISKTMEDSSLDAHQKLHKILIDQLRLVDGGTQRKKAESQMRSFDSLLASVEE